TEVAMKDPRVVEIEFLADLDQNQPPSITASGYVAKLGVSEGFVKDLIWALFRDGCLEGQNEVRPETATVSKHWGSWHREQSVTGLLRGQAFVAYINHRGRVRLWQLRDDVQKARIKEKFGIIWD